MSDEYIADGHRYTVRDGVVYRDGAALPRAAILRLAPVDSELWAWLRSQGVRRPSPSGARGYEGARDGQVRVQLWLSDEDAAELARIADAAGASRAAVVARWIRESKKSSG